MIVQHPEQQAPGSESSHDAPGALQQWSTPDPPHKPEQQVLPSRHSVPIEPQGGGVGVVGNFGPLKPRRAASACGASADPVTATPPSPKAALIRLLRLTPEPIDFVNASNF